MKIINLEPHEVNICDRNGNVIKTYERSGKVARIASGYAEVDYVDGVPIVVRQEDKTVNLPEPQEGVMYIVSNVVLNFCSDRTDLLAPVKQVKIRGRVVGCMAFASNR